MAAVGLPLRLSLRSRAGRPTARHRGQSGAAQQDAGLDTERVGQPDQDDDPHRRRARQALAPADRPSARGGAR